MYSEEERAKWRDGFKRWKETGESPWKAGKRLPRFATGTEGESNYSDTVYKNMYYINNDTSPEYLGLIDRGVPEKTALGWIKEGVNNYPNLYALKGPTLPEVIITPNKNARNDVLLTTYYPVTSEYWATGHSRLDTPGGNVIDVASDDPNYNFVLNNCSDATREALEQATGKKINPWFFTTPGDVKSFAEDVLGGKSFDNGDGSVSTFINLPQKQINKIALYARKLRAMRYLQHIENTQNELRNK